MLNRPLLFLGVLAAAVAVPYIMLDENLAQTARAQWNRLVRREQPSDPQALEKLLSSSTPVTPVSASPAALEETFRFEITPQWVTSRWPQVSTVAGDGKQLGMRVALVSGTRADDVAGSLTYYFDDYHQLQQITFTGLTGDPQRLLAAIVPQHSFQSLPTTDVAHYVAGDLKKPSSEITVKLLPVIRTDAKSARAEINLNLRRSSLLQKQSKSWGLDPSPPLPAHYRTW